VSPSPNQSPVKKTKACITDRVASLADLIRIVDTYGEASADTSIEYNIDVAALTAIRPELAAIDAMVGMADIKASVLHQLLYFMQKLHVAPAGAASREGDYMHTVIYGPPGSGKTEIAERMGRMYAKLGVLRTGTFRKVTRADLVAGFLGQTALKTRKVIEDCLGGCLFIDEAYALGNGSKEADAFSNECIDTLCAALSEHRGDLMVIVAGYEAELKARLFSANSGLDSRFIWRFRIAAYSPADLAAIFVKKVADAGWSADANTLPDWFSRHRAVFKFGGRDVQMLFSHAKLAHSTRMFGAADASGLRSLTMDDVDAARKALVEHGAGTAVSVTHSMYV
jgi:Holliday junction resolvasome RuvABC ATP-dependent DNA helicase subunit